MNFLKKLAVGLSVICIAIALCLGIFWLATVQLWLLITVVIVGVAYLVGDRILH